MPSSQRKKKLIKEPAWTPPTIEKGDSIVWPLSILIIGLIVCLVPFIDKAFHIDDPMFIWAAKHIHTHPMDFYGFQVNWRGREIFMYSETMNPPLNSYFIALSAYLVGWKETSLHMVYLLPAIATVMGTYFLARQLCPLPFLATLIGMTSPIFLLSHTNVMCDTLMLAFWIWAIFFWVRGLERNSNPFLFFSAFLISLSMLTKFVAISLIPLLFAYSLFKRRSLGRWWVYFLIPLVFLAGYEWITYTLYGTGHLYSTVKFTTIDPKGGSFPIQYNVLAGLAFTGGCLANVLFFSPLLTSRRIMLAGIILLLILILWVSLLNIPFFQNKDEILWTQVFQMGVFCVTGLSVLIIATKDFWERKDSSSLLLFFWVIGIFVFLIFVNWTINGRTILIMTPAVGILVARRIAQQFVTFSGKSYLNLVWPIIPSVILAFTVTWADYQMANRIQYAANNLIKNHKPEARALWFNGHWGFQYYMESGGGKQVDVDSIEIGDGDIVIIPENVSVVTKFRTPDIWAINS